MQPGVTHDYALLKLKEPVAGAKDFAPLSESIGQINQKELIILGYPAKDNYKPTTLQRKNFNVDQFGAAETGKVKEVLLEKGEIKHKISTLPGQSGAPIILDDQGKFKIVGIHKGGIKEEQVNGGRIMTSELIATLEAEVSRMGAVRFLVDSQPGNNSSQGQGQKKEELKINVKKELLEDANSELSAL